MLLDPRQRPVAGVLRPHARQHAAPARRVVVRHGAHTGGPGGEHGGSQRAVAGDPGRQQRALVGQLLDPGGGALALAGAQREQPGGEQRLYRGPERVEVVGPQRALVQLGLAQHYLEAEHAEVGCQSLDVGPVLGVQSVQAEVEPLGVEVVLQLRHHVGCLLQVDVGLRGHEGCDGLQPLLPGLVLQAELARALGHGIEEVHPHPGVQLVLLAQTQQDSQDFQIVLLVEMAEHLEQMLSLESVQHLPGLDGLGPGPGEGGGDEEDDLGPLLLAGGAQQPGGQVQLGQQHEGERPVTLGQLADGAVYLDDLVTVLDVGAEVGGEEGGEVRGLEQDPQQPRRLARAAADHHRGEELQRVGDEVAEAGAHQPVLRDPGGHKVEHGQREAVVRAGGGPLASAQVLLVQPQDLVARAVEAGGRRHEGHRGRGQQPRLHGLPLLAVILQLDSDVILFPGLGIFQQNLGGSATVNLLLAPLGARTRLPDNGLHLLVSPEQRRELHVAAVQGAVGRGVGAEVVGHLTQHPQRSLQEVQECLLGAEGGHGDTGNWGAGH